MFPRLLFLLATCVIVLPSAIAHDRKTKSPDMEVLDLTAQREEGLITVEARVRNSGKHPLRELNVIFRFADGVGTTLTTQRTTVDEPILNPGDESTIHAQMKDSPYAARVTVLAETGQGTELHVGNAGPFPVDQ